MAVITNGAGAFGKGLDQETKSAFKKIRICELMRWTLREYEQHTSSEIEQIISYLNATEEKKQSREKLNG